MIDDQNVKVLKMNVPYYMHAEMKVDPYLLEDIQPEQFGGSACSLLHYTKPMDLKYIQNVANGMMFTQHIAQTAEHFPQYIKNHPGRFASGVGLLDGGVGGDRLYLKTHLSLTKMLVALLFGLVLSLFLLAHGVGRNAPRYYYFSKKIFTVYEIKNPNIS